MVSILSIDYGYVVNENIIAVVGGRFPNVVTEKADLRESKTGNKAVDPALSARVTVISISMALIGGFG